LWFWVPARDGDDIVFADAACIADGILTTQIPVLATQIAPELSNSSALQLKEGTGKAERRLAPMVRVQQEARGRTTGAAEIARPSLRDGFTAYT
jgi:hypothetical protein